MTSENLVTINVQQGGVNSNPNFSYDYNESWSMGNSSLALHVTDAGINDSGNYICSFLSRSSVKETVVKYDIRVIVCTCFKDPKRNVAQKRRLISCDLNGYNASRIEHIQVELNNKLTVRGMITYTKLAFALKRPKFPRTVRFNPYQDAASKVSCNIISKQVLTSPKMSTVSSTRSTDSSPRMWNPTTLSSRITPSNTYLVKLVSPTAYDQILTEAKDKDVTPIEPLKSTTYSSTIATTRTSIENSVNPTAYDQMLNEAQDPGVISTDTPLKSTKRSSVIRPTLPSTESVSSSHHGELNVPIVTAISSITTSMKPSSHPSTTTATLPSTGDSIRTSSNMMPTNRAKDALVVAATTTMSSTAYSSTITTTQLSNADSVVPSKEMLYRAHANATTIINTTMKPTDRSPSHTNPVLSIKELARPSLNQKQNLTRYITIIAAATTAGVILIIAVALSCLLYKRFTKASTTRINVMFDLNDSLDADSQSARCEEDREESSWEVNL